MQLLQPNTTLQGGKYKIIRTLGQGGFGITYLAEQVMLDRKVAIKEFFMKEYCDRDESTSRVTMGSEGSRDSVNRYREKFLKEARNIAKLNHPNIVKIIDVFEENDTAYYVMEYVKGQSLREYVKQTSQSRLSEDEALKLFQPIKDSLGYLHENRVTHLDIKPDNILIRENGAPVIVDFGLSKHYSSKGTPTSTIKAAGCSTGYSPMEQYVGITTFTPEADIYALGATLYNLLTNKKPPLPSDIDDDRSADKHLALPMPATVSEKTKQLILSMLTTDRLNRPQSVEDIIVMMVNKSRECVNLFQANDMDETMLIGIEKTDKTNRKREEGMPTDSYDKENSDYDFEEEKKEVDVRAPIKWYWAFVIFGLFWLFSLIFGYLSRLLH